MTGRFQKGQSGNPNGRPKKQTEAANDLTTALDQRTKVKLNGKILWLNPLEQVLLVMCQKAMTGDVRAGKMLFDRFGDRLPALSGEDDSRRPITIQMRSYSEIPLDLLDAWTDGPHQTAYVNHWIIEAGIKRLIELGRSLDPLREDDNFLKYCAEPERALALLEEFDPDD